MPSKLTKTAARKALAAIRAQFDVDVHTGPLLVQDYESMSGSRCDWALVWEEGPYEWTYGAFEAHTTESGYRIEGVARPARVFAEAVNHFVLGLYRDDSLAESVPTSWADLDAMRTSTRASRAAELVARELADADKVMGVTAYIYESKLGNSSNGGLSTRVATVTVVGDGIPRTYEANPLAPAVEIVETVPGYRTLRPLDPPPAGHTGYMAGGCYVKLDHHQVPEKLRGFLPLHDRSETYADYEMLTR
jgi:hypothetical protein